MDIDLSERALYDLENPSSSELPFPLDLAKKFVRTGLWNRPNIIPMAKTGVFLIAVDVHEGMLKREKEKASP